MRTQFSRLNFKNHSPNPFLPSASRVTLCAEL
nr:MAG TPA_asm: hypothetical protein [Caudoviricetes sp.]